MVSRVHQASEVEPDTGQHLVARDTLLIIGIPVVDGAIEFGAERALDSSTDTIASQILVDQRRRRRAVAACLPQAGVGVAAIDMEQRAMTDHGTDPRARVEVAPDVRAQIGVRRCRVRYGHSVASRFRAADVRPGIFYASEVEATAVIEIIYWRLRFYLRSIDFVPSTTVSEHLSFRADVKAARCLDLTAPPFDADTALWTDPTSYAACQELAATARIAETQIIRSTSARDPHARANLAILDPAAFASSQPHYGQTWHLRFEGDRLTAFAAFPSNERIAFSAQDFGLAVPH